MFCPVALSTHFKKEREKMENKMSLNKNGLNCHGGFYSTAENSYFRTRVIVTVL